MTCPATTLRPMSPDAEFPYAVRVRTLPVNTLLVGVVSVSMTFSGLSEESLEETRTHALSMAVGLLFKSWSFSVILRRVPAGSTYGKAKSSAASEDSTNAEVDAVVEGLVSLYEATKDMPGTTPRRIPELMFVFSDVRKEPTKIPGADGGFAGRRESVIESTVAEADADKATTLTDSEPVEDASGSSSVTVTSPFRRTSDKVSLPSIPNKPFVERTASGVGVVSR